MRSPLNLISLATFALSTSMFSCGGSQPAAQSPDGTSASTSDGGTAVPAGEVAATEQKCGAADQVQKHNINQDGPTQAFAPCSADGKGDYSGIVKIETIPDGVHITIQATDDEVDSGVLGSDVKNRDAVIVYPKGKTEKAIEVPLVKNATGYTGDKIVLWDDLDKLNGEGTKIDIAVFDHDKSSGKPSEELHIQVAVSTGKSCEKAQEENPQTMDMGSNGGHGSRDLSSQELGAAFGNGSLVTNCGLADAADADVCAAVKNGKALGVSVDITPKNNKVAACIDRATRKLSFPTSDKLDVVKEHY